MHRISLPFVPLVLILLASPIVAEVAGDVVATEMSSADSWPGWAGPRGDRTGVAGALFAPEALALKENWKREAGPGYSGLANVEGVTILPFSDGERDRLVALDREGGEQWSYDLGPTYKGHDGSDDGPLATPTIADGAVYFLAPRGALVALNRSTGTEIWRRELLAGLDTNPPYYGFASSVLVAGDVVVAQTGIGGGRSLVGLNRETGEDAWALGDDPIGYQSPSLMTIGGVAQVIAVTNRQMLSVEPESGRLLWAHVLSEGGSEEGSQHPIPVGDDGILLTNRPGSTLYRWRMMEGTAGVEEVWSSTSIRGYATPIYRDGYVYGYSGKILVCADAETGEAVWKSREPGRGMLIAAGDQLIIQTESGEIVVADASPEGYRERAALIPFESGYPSAPSFSGGRIYVRSPRRVASLSVVPTVVESTEPDHSTGEPSPVEKNGVPEPGR